MPNGDDRWGYQNKDYLDRTTPVERIMHQLEALEKAHGEIQEKLQEARERIKELEEQKGELKQQVKALKATIKMVSDD